MQMVADEDQPRSHGFQRPFHPLQLVSWVVFGSDCVLFVVFCLPIVEGVSAQVCLTVGFLVSIVLLVFVTAKATGVDPADPNVGKDESQIPDADISSLPFCRMCNVTVRARSKHCRACNKCTDVFDHHCMWLNNCIGEANYRWFFATVSAVVMMIGIVLATCLYLLVDYFVNDEFEQRVTDIAVFADFPEEFFLGILIFMCVLNTPLLLLDLQLVVLHLFLVSQNLTTYEYIMNQRFPGEDGGTAGKLRRHIRKLPSCMDWIVFSRCGRRRRPKSSGTKEVQVQKASGTADRPIGEANGTVLAAGPADANGGPRPVARGVEEKVPSPPGSTVDAEDYVTCSPRELAPRTTSRGSGAACSPREPAPRNTSRGSGAEASAEAQTRPGAELDADARLMQEPEGEDAEPMSAAEDGSIAAKLGCGCDGANAKQQTPAERARA